MAENETEVCGTFGEAAHKVGEPVLAVGNVDADAIAILDEPALQIGAHPVQHLKLEIVFGNLLRRGMANGRRNRARVVRGDTVIKTAGEKRLHQADEVGIDIDFPPIRNIFWLLVLALAKTDAAAIRQ